MGHIVKFEKDGKEKIIRVRDDGLYNIIKTANGFCWGKTHDNFSEYVKKLTEKGWKKVSDNYYEGIRKRIGKR